ncbi:ATP12 family chaperone protein [Celeribacter sp.]|uniref:ATP12 family chaperone protein n=1 Tax=Celeribacter sp. TaxID=1890673 RepID=UPI003A923981
MAEWAAKRFWKETAVIEDEGGFAVHLDGRPVRTPAKAPLIVPTRALAEAIAAEWDAQDEQIDPHSMHATRGANAAIDRVTIHHDEVVTMLADYGDSDLTCYRAPHPMELAERQAAAWDPMLDWVAERFDARLEPRTGVMHYAQPDQARANLRAEVARLNAFELSAFHDLVTLSGSLVIALAAIHDQHPIETLWDMSRIDETFQIEQWGVDEEAAEEAAIKRGSFLRAHVFYTSVQS